VCLRLALSDKAGRMPLFDSPSTGLSTLNRDEADRLTRDGFQRETVMVEVKTLAEICLVHAQRPIDFMTIDVEGHETEVLRGADFSRQRPKVVVIEATHPNSTDASHAAWEPIMLAADYHFAAFDGVNRFYVAAEHAALVPLVAVPPNALDLYVPAAQWRAAAELRHLERSPVTALPVRLDRLLRRLWRRLGGG